MTAVKFKVAPLDVWHEAFPAIAQSSGLALTVSSAQDVELSEAHAARFLLALLRQRRWLRWCFPRALSEGERGRFCRWLSKHGRQKLGLSARALTKIRGAFRRRPGERVYEIYLNDPELQKLYPLGLLPVGQRHFLDWLTTHGRADQELTDDQILWFLQESAEDPGRGVALTYLLTPNWQEQFPLALTKDGWRRFSRWLIGACEKAMKKFLRSVPPVLSRANQRSIEQSISDSAARTGPTRVEGVNMLGHFCNPSGIQQAAIWAKAALDRAGLRTSCRDVPVPRRIIPTDRADWLGLEIFPFTILTHAATPYFASGYERSGLWRRNGVYRIAYWNWELETLPDEWLQAAPLIDEIWSPTEFVANAMRSRMPRPVYNMLPGVEIGAVQPVAQSSFGIPENHCVFLFMFDFHSQLHRKNPVGAIRAFQKAFRRDDAATLVIKTSGGDIHTADLAVLRQMCQSDNVILLDEQMSRARAYGMIAMCDCFVSLHRSEGFGLGMAEAMLMGKPVIGTGYSGNLSFMNPENSMLVDYNIVEIAEDRSLYTRGNFWAEPSVDHASSYMRHLYENRDQALSRAARVRPEIERKLSLEAAGYRMRNRLQEIIESGWAIR